MNDKDGAVRLFRTGRAHRPEQETHHSPVPTATDDEHVCPFAGSDQALGRVPFGGASGHPLIEIH